MTTTSHRARRAALAIVACLAASFAGCAADRPGEAVTITLASTTSTEDSGLFDELIPAFQEDHPGIRVRVIAVGSGQALEIGRRRDADVLLVHSPAAESVFVAQGHAEARHPVMHNDLIIVGPAEDPAGARTAASAADALRRIAEARAVFVSRGDESGTHMAELALWNAAGIAVPGAPLSPVAREQQDAAPARKAADWYLDAGQGMADVLRIASERQAYTLTDRATFTALQATLRLEVIFEGDAALANPYSVITVRGASHPTGARIFADWLIGPRGQAVIARFGRDRFGHPLFNPANMAVESDVR